jgi:hypothetical protein
MGIKALGMPHDLDGRSSDIHRSTIYLLLQKCRNCGYISPDITKGELSVKEIVKDLTYITISDDFSIPEAVSSFLCWSIILERQGDYSLAGEACLYAAWACDDSGATQKAVEYRKKALSFLLKARSAGLQFARTEKTEQFLLIDIMRRAQLFKDAMILCDETGIKIELLEDEECILLFERKLIAAGDFRNHTIKEALNDLS